MSDRRRALIELEDLPANAWLMEQFGQGGGDVVTRDLVVRLRGAEGDPSS